MFDNNQAGMGYNPLAGNLRRQQVPQGPAMGMSGMWPGAYMPSGYPQDRQGTSNMWIPVKNLDEARNAFVQPGEQKWFMVDVQMMFAMKAVSSAGVMDFQAFDFAPHVETQVQQTTTQQPVQPNVLEEVAKMMQGVIGRLEGLEAAVDGLKGEKENGKPVKQVSVSTARTGAGTK